MTSDDIEKKLENGREYRSMHLSVRSDEGADSSMVVEGYAATFNQPYLLYEERDYKVMEQIDPGAFTDCDMTDVIFQYDHAGRVFARTKNRTLTCTPDDTGLKITADLGGTAIGQQLYTEIRDGYTDKMSFGFAVAEDKRESVEDRDTGFVTLTRTITKIKKLYDVSAVSMPANDATSISARNLSDGLIREIQAERLERANIIRRINLKLTGV